MEHERRSSTRNDRRAISRSGRRDGEQKKPWYMRRRLWLAAASMVFVGWRRVRALGNGNRYHTNIAA